MLAFSRGSGCQAGDNPLDVPDRIEPKVTPPQQRTGPGSRLALASAVAVGVAIVLLVMTVYCVVAAPVFRVLAGTSSRWLVWLVGRGALLGEAFVCQAVLYLVVGISIWGAVTGALSLRLEHAEVDRRWLSIASMAAGILVPVLAVLALWWSWEFVARTHFAGR